MKRLLRGGRVVDPASGRDGVFDVVIDEGRIVRVGKDLPIDDAVVVEIPRGFVVCPGLIVVRRSANSARRLWAPVSERPLQLPDSPDAS